MARKQISDAVKKKLFALSGNQCCFPNCTERVYNLEDDVLLGEMCHISAVSGSGARYDPELQGVQVNSYENILVLCPTHHTTIDKNEEKYSANVLRKMKEVHESKFYNNANQFDELIEQSEGEIGAERLKELEAIETTFDEAQEPEESTLPVKKAYPAPEGYIQRYVSAVRKANEYSFQSKTLAEVVENENKLTVLGVAGSGKSVELAQLAYLHSQPESDFYPVKIRLNILTYQPIEELLKLEYPEFDQVPQNRLLILLDALDEVHTDYIDVAASNIEILSKKYVDANIVISCRNNFYVTETDKRNAKLEGFSTYLIKPLQYPSVYQYLKDNLQVDPEVFIEDLRMKKFYDLLYSPFYLVNLVSFFQAEKEVPKSKKTIFEYLIHQRIEADFEKYGNAGVNVHDFASKVDSVLEQLAVLAGCLGRNYLMERTEVQRYVQDHTLFKVLKRTHLFDKSPHHQRWEFEHNNFQEYLAARFLSAQEFEEIQQFVSFAPDFKKIKPSWLNTLSFLFSLWEKESDNHTRVVKWIQEIEPDILVRFEKDKIELNDREQLFRQIYEEYESKQIIIRNEKFESEDLAIFVSDSTSIIEYLIGKVESSSEQLIISEALRILPYFDHISEHTKRVREVLVAKIVRKDLSDEVKYSCLYALANLNINDQELTKEILEHNDLGGSQYIRAGFYKYLEASDEFEDHSGIVLQGIELIEKPIVRVNGQPEQSTIQLSDEKYALEALLNKIRSANNIRVILKWASEHESHSNFENIFFEQISNTLEKASIVFKSGAKDVFDNVLNLLLSFSRRYYQDLGADFRKFFEATKTQFKAFVKLYAEWHSKTKDDFHLTHAMILVCNEECIHFLLKQITEGKLVDSWIFKFRSLLQFHGSQAMFEVYQEELLKIDHGKYAVHAVDHEQLRKSRRNRDLELLFLKDEFLNEVTKIFDEEAENEKRLTWDELYDWRRKKFNDEEMTNQIVVDTLRERAREKKFVELAEIEELLADDNRWLWFTLHKIVNYDRNQDDFEYTAKIKEFITNWVLDAVQYADFKSAIEPLPEGRYHYRFTEPYISFFVQRLDIDLKDSSLLDMLNVECYLVPIKSSKVNNNEKKERSTFDFLVEKLGVDPVSARVMENLRSGILAPIVKHTHFVYCQEYKIKEAAPIIFDEILKEGTDSYNQRLYITQFTDLSGDNQKLFDILDQLSLEVRQHATKKLAEKNFNPVIEYIVCQLEKESDEDIRLRYIQIVGTIDSVQRVAFLKEWILRNKRLPEDLSRSNVFESATIDDLIEIFEDALVNNYGTSPWASRNDYLLALVEKGSHNENDFLIVRGQLSKWLESDEELRFLHYQIQKLEQQYYTHKSQAITFEEAVELVRP